MSLSLATKGIISGIINTAGSYPVPTAVCDPEPTSDEIGALHADATIVSEDVVDITPGVSSTTLPDPVEGDEVLPTLRTLPLPSNL